MKLVYFVDTSDNHKDELCVFNPEDYTDREKLASAINDKIRNAVFLDACENPEAIYEIGRCLAYNGFAVSEQFGYSYEFGIEEVEVI